MEARYFRGTKTQTSLHARLRKNLSTSILHRSSRSQGATSKTPTIPNQTTHSETIYAADRYSSHGQRHPTAPLPKKKQRDRSSGRRLMTPNPANRYPTTCATGRCPCSEQTHQSDRFPTRLRLALTSTLHLTIPTQTSRYQN